MSKKLWSGLLAAITAFCLCFGIAGCDFTGGNGGNTHTSHDWSTTYTNDGDRHYQTCSGCTEKQYSDHNYGTGGVCVCGKTQSSAHTSHNWSKTYTNGGDQHYQTCDGCDEKQYSNHDYGTSGVCVCGKQQPANPDTPTKYTVTFEPNGGIFANGESTYSVQVNEGEKVNSVTVTREKNYKFLGWYSDEEHTVLWDFDNDTVTKAITLYAGWEYVNPYQPIIDAFQAKLKELHNMDAEILSIFVYNNYLACKVIAADGWFYTLYVRLSTTNNSLLGDTIDTEYYVNGINAATRVTFESVLGDGRRYSSERSPEEQQMVENMITKLLGDGYSIIWGTITSTRDNGATSFFGGANSASFDVYALVEKDGTVFEYKETLTVNKDYGDVYQAVLNSTEANRDNVYRDNGKTPTDLGEVAASFYAERKKEQEVNQNIVA